MIHGIGIDNIELSRIALALEHSEKFARKILTPKEFAGIDELFGQRLIEFIAGRWAAKEAFGKAYGTGIETRRLGFQNLEITNDLEGKPYFSQFPFDGNVQLSISHSKTEAVAVVILED